MGGYINKERILNEVIIYTVGEDGSFIKEEKTNLSHPDVFLDGL